MKLDDLIERVRRGDGASGLPLSIDAVELRVTVQRTLLALDLHVANDGEIYSPAPPPSLVVPNVPAMNAARYGGRKRRR